MSLCSTSPRRRRAGLIAVFGGSSAATIGLSRHHEGVSHPLVWQDIGIAVGIVLIILALTLLVVSGLRRR